MMTTMLTRGPRAFWLVLAAALLAAPTTGQEGEWEPDADRRNCICFDDMADRMSVFRVGSRARLGVMLGAEAEVDGRTGIRLEDVPDGTPAYRAGLREGDVVVALDGAELADEPVDAVLEFMGERNPGDTVEVTFCRDGDERTVRVVTEAAEGYGFFSEGPDYRFRVAPGFGEGIRDRVRGVVTPHLERGRAGSFMLRRLGGHDMELVEINPELGEYFGTERGVLVVEIETDSPLGLRTGDVILAIDGREVRDPAHVRSILASYRDDEMVTFEVVRDGRRIDVSGTVE